ncbi:STAS domain-containing protein [Rhodobacter sp. 24-YEA-8]|uniref:STAS domain-containing protein n=1 Tax=Rhodobacter sp. 24-YEA-8 TaxID=1884310 RepID=UPI000898E8F5|nr:STAS domain-containing protein [Rhodobacter sp. 24-YEA-8]SEB74272.1 STAS domain-containing protein [Rhodobacter sp. 24-YEA-8]
MPGSELPVSGLPEVAGSDPAAPDSGLPDSDPPDPDFPASDQAGSETRAQSAKLELAERADPLGDPAILAFLRRHQDQPVEVDASRLRQPNGPLIETLLVAARTWRTRGIAFSITGLAPGHVEQLRWLGLAAPLGLDPGAEVLPV